MAAVDPQQDTAEELVQFLDRYYRDEIGTLAQRYPDEQRSLVVDYDDLVTFDQRVANDLEKHPGRILEFLDEALRRYDLPADIDLSNATVRVENLHDSMVHYPGHYSPTEHHGEYIGIKGEVVVASDVRPRVIDAAFECQRCGTMTYIPQVEGRFQEPHECKGCERQGPFEVNFDQSEFIDAQTLRVQEPPSVSGGGGRDITVDLEGDLTDEVGVGDSVVVSGTLHLTQRTKGNQKTGEFEQFLAGRALEVEETDHRSYDIDDSERRQIRELAAGEHGDPLTIAAQSLSMKVIGYDHIKRAIILGLVGGHRVTGGDGGADRGSIHILFLGDPGTSKSKLGSRAEMIAPRAVGVSGKRASAAGLTASTVRDELNDGQWTLDPGAFVRANGGTVWIDELDDMSADHRAAMLEPMAEQKVNVTQAGINAKLATRAGVLAAGNPKYGRFDPYEPVAQQFDFGSALLSRFDLIFTLSDQPDRESDIEIATHVAEYRETAKRMERDPDSVTDADREKAEAPVSTDLLTKWIALAKQQPAPLTEDGEIYREKAEAFADLRAANGYDPDSPVPTTFRKWEAVLRIAEAAAKFELSDVVRERHYEIAMELVGQSMQDYGKDEDGNLDADVVETGQSKKTTDTSKLVEDILEEEAYGEELPIDEVVDLVQEEDSTIEESTVVERIDNLCSERGYAIQPTMGETVKWLGRH